MDDHFDKYQSNQPDFFQNFNINYDRQKYLIQIIFYVNKPKKVFGPTGF